MLLVRGLRSCLTCIWINLIHLILLEVRYNWRLANLLLKQQSTFLLGLLILALLLWVGSRWHCRRRSLRRLRGSLNLIRWRDYLLLYHRLMVLTAWYLAVVCSLYRQITCYCMVTGWWYSGTYRWNKLLSWRTRNSGDCRWNYSCCCKSFTRTCTWTCCKYVSALILVVSVNFYLVQQIKEAAF